MRVAGRLGMRSTLLLLLAACSDYALTKGSGGPTPYPDTGAPDVPMPAPRIVLDPEVHDFGVVAVGAAAPVNVQVRNEGRMALHVSDVRLAPGDGMSLDVRTGENGPLPWVLQPGEARRVAVTYAPSQAVGSEAWLQAASDDPDQPLARAHQFGMARPFPGLAGGWYIVDDPSIFDTDVPDRAVDRVGDPDGYWYEASGVHGLLGSVDPAGDFEILAAWIRARAGTPTPVTGPLDLRAASSVRRLRGVSFAYVLCDFWIDPGDDPSRYVVALDDVDDGARVLLDGQVLGQVEYGQSGSWTLAGAATGRLHTLVVLVQDNAAVDKYVLGLRFTRDGVTVTG
jgi:hypothetical protein